MFDNIGQKIKGTIEILCWVGMLGSVIAGLAAMEHYFFNGLLIAVIGCLCSWIGSFLLYGFGELVDNSAKIAENTRCLNRSEDKPTDADSNS